MLSTLTSRNFGKLYTLAFDAIPLFHWNLCLQPWLAVLVLNNFIHSTFCWKIPYHRLKIIIFEIWEKNYPAFVYVMNVHYYYAYQVFVDYCEYIFKFIYLCIKCIDLASWICLISFTISRPQFTYYMVLNIDFTLMRTQYRPLDFFKLLCVLGTCFQCRHYWQCLDGVQFFSFLYIASPS